MRGFEKREKGRTNEKQDLRASAHTHLLVVGELAGGQLQPDLSRARLAKLGAAVVGDGHGRQRHSHGGASEVHDAPDVATAWAALDTAPFDVMLLDYELNGEDGLSILEELRARAEHPNTNMAVVVLTGHAEAHVVKEAVQKGADAYLVKPVAPDVLGNRIIEVLESRHDQGHAAPVSEVVWRRSNR